MKGKITISGNGIVSVPDRVTMRDFEIAELFEVMIPTVRSNIRTILKTGIATTDLTNGATVIGNNVLPDFHGLDMVVALAFRVQSSNAQLFRRWVIARLAKEKRHEPQLYIRLPNNATIH